MKKLSIIDFNSACKEHDEKKIKQFVLDHVENPKVLYRGIAMACKTDNVNVLECIQHEMTIDWNYKNPTSYAYLIHDMVEFNAFHVFSYALKFAKHIDFNCVELMGMTPLHFACLYHRLNFLKLLLEYGADPTILDKEHSNPLSVCCVNGNLDCARLLLPLTPDVSTVDHFDMDCLSCACHYHQFTIVSFLLSSSRVSFSTSPHLHRSALHFLLT
mmetsp:Transcript_1386/g.2087  ORF Transcript_1386/g.2087 Transcript_1386/m.2087 type:complete len:215 (+) Transcript_1386:21-665(+)